MGHATELMKRCTGLSAHLRLGIEGQHSTLRVSVPVIQLMSDVTIACSLRPSDRTVILLSPLAVYKGDAAEPMTPIMSTCSSRRSCSSMLAVNGKTMPAISLGLFQSVTAANSLRTLDAYMTLC